jgi:hypothetical protein
MIHVLLFSYCDCMQGVPSSAPTASSATTSAPSPSNKPSKRAAKGAKKHAPAPSQQQQRRRTKAELEVIKLTQGSLRDRMGEWGNMVLHFATHYKTLRTVLFADWLLLDWMEVRSAWELCTEQKLT